MGVYGGPVDWWTDGTDEGRTHVTTKGIVTSGLILNLDSGSKSSYLGSGITWSDLSGNGYDGTLTNGPTYSSSNGGLIVFDGSDDYVVGVHNATLDVTGDMTAECWFKLTSNRSDWVCLFSKGELTAGRTFGLWIYQVTDPGYFLFQRYEPVGAQYPGASITDTVRLDTWYQIVGVSSSTTLQLYLNGSLVATSTYATASSYVSSTVPYNVGTIEQQNAYSHAGEIPISRLYNRALTSEEVKQNFDAIRGRFSI